MVLGRGREFLVLERDPPELQVPQGWEARSVHWSVVGTA